MRATTSVARAITACIVTAVIPAVLHSQIRITERTVLGTPTIMSDGPAPTIIQVDGTPAKSSLQWQPVAGAVKYTIQRSKEGDANCCNAQSGDLSAPAWTDLGPNNAGFQSSGTYVYAITAWQPDGKFGTTTVKWIRPDPRNPGWFLARQTGEGTVALSWQNVEYASYYWLWGPGTGVEGMRVDGDMKTLTGITAGPKEWSITTRYDPAGVLLAPTTWPKAQLNVVSMTGLYRITLNGFQVVQPVKDPMLSGDGVGSEVFTWSFVRVYDRANGGVLNKGVVESAVHGDTEGFGGRVPAGSAKSTGGLIAGDKFPSATPWSRGNSVSTTTFPLLLWEGSLTDKKEVILITPTIWEWNGTTMEPASRYQVESLNPYLEGQLATHWAQTSSALADSSGWAGPKAVPMTWPGWGPLVGMKPFSESGLSMRPIGGVPHPANTDRYAVPHTGIVFTRELIEKALSSTTQIGGMAPGVIEVKFADDIPGSKASYVLYFQVARQ